LAPIGALPAIAAVLPKPQFAEYSEQFLPVPRMPGVGTPASVRLLGKAARYEVASGEIVDRAQGIVWQRELAKTTMSFEEAVFYCEASRVGGHDDWRLPTAFEMHGIFAPSLPPPALLDPKLFSAPDSALLWTRTDDDGPWVGSPQEGIVISTHYDDPSPYGNYHVRCVRPGVTRATQMVDRFAQKDGVLHDALSGLSWYLLPNGQGMTQTMAKQVCDQGSFGGFNDWSVPTVETAFSLMSACPDAVENWEADADDVWTSMVDPESKVGGTFRVCNLHRSVPLAAIFEKEGIDSKNPLARVMCVRETVAESAPEAKACLMGSQVERIGNTSVCKEKGVLHGPFQSSWPSGGVFETGTYEHGIRSGMFVMYHEAGGIYARGDYVKGKLHGEIWARRPTGLPLFKGAYKNGLPSGRWIFFDMQGREAEYIDMTAGEAGGGQYVRYGESGGKVIASPTLGGWEHGIERSFDEKTGQVRAEFTYEGGWLEGPAKTIEPGQGGQTGRYHLGERDGVWVGKNSEGQIVFRQSYRNGKLEGPQESFSAGKLSSSRRYRDDMAIGHWETRDADGTLVQKGELDEDGTGLVTSYSSKGEVDREERYVRGKRHGTWVVYLGGKQIGRKEEYRDGQLESLTEWHDDGKIDEQITYSAGRKNGLAERYDSQGRLRWRGVYVNGRRHGRWEFTNATGHHYEVVFEKGKAVLLGAAK
jgi:antitoxin component YwqK of YwqJK toxin-antitoxin module